jgi:malate synthase
MGGMAAQIPIGNDAEANASAMARVQADKLREVHAGHDGTWVAHPALIPLARGIFDQHMPGRHQHQVAREDVEVSREDLLAPSRGTVTRQGFEGSVEVCVRYLAAWLDGNGCVPIHWLMEDAATAEIARAQLWQWLHHDDVCLDDDTPIDLSLFEAVLLGLPPRLAGETMPGTSKLGEAIVMLAELTHADIFADFLTLPAYERLD